MAIWQYSFLVIPKIVIDNGGVKPYIDEDGFLDDEACWLIKPLNVDFFNSFENILPRSDSWSTEIMLFGNQESNRFEIYKNENNEVTSVSFRLDHTTEYEEILRSIIHFIAMNGLVILDEKLELIDNNYITIKSLVEQSDQQATFEKLSNPDERGL